MRGQCANTQTNLIGESMVGTDPAMGHDPIKVPRVDQGATSVGAVFGSLKEKINIQQ